MRIGPLITLLSTIYGVPEPTTVLVARAMREAGWLTTGARGVNAPEMAIRDVARLSLALLTGEPPSKVVEAFEFVSTLQTKEPYPASGFVSQDDVPADHTLEEAVTAIFKAISDERRLAHYSTHFSSNYVSPPHVSISLDSSRQVAQLDLPGVRAEYLDLRGLIALDELYGVRSLTLEVWEQIQAIEGRSTMSFDSPNPVNGRGMRVVRSITEAEIIAICKGIREHDTTAPR